ncbi:hypothetical protein NDU88_003533 [Pleurodeles waltl]|uniref:Ubiquitin-like domain-containing protein n=1 Tax=Pleurodeles waltl TaxID=8319 RepID=A0AAV7LG42_PLEWA|nr:hypothetical protein NDU88_003533 [Pleurodeles waltl]
MVFQVFLLGLDSPHTIDVADSESDFKTTNIKTFKELVAKKLSDVAKLQSVDPGDIRLVFANKPLQEDAETFEQAGILPKSSILMILGLPGGRW